MADEEIPVNELLVDVEDGIVVGLYHFLWLKDGKGRPCPEVNIPHTIIYANGRPVVWYFTSGKDRCIKRKHKSTISNPAINDAFAPPPKASMEGYGGEASLDNNASNGAWGGLNSTAPAGSGGQKSGKDRPGITVELVDEAKEWFSQETLREVVPPGAVVVHGVAALHEGVLQKFVQPRGQHYFSLRATWSPNACVVERRTAKSKINDPRVPLSERLAGFDSPVWLSDHTVITGSVLQGTVSRMCDNIAAHLADVSKGEVRVLRMVLFFAVDEANRIWLTHASTLRTQRPREEAVLAGLARGNSQRQHGSGGGAGLYHAVQPQHALHLRALDGGMPGAEPGEGLDLPAPSPAFASARAAAGEDEDDASSSGRFLCVLTGEMYSGSVRCDVTYKQLLQHWFSLASQLPNEGDRLRAMDTIPLAIRRANPSLTREWYLRVRSQPNFLYRTAPVCAEAAGQLTGMALEELQRTMAGRPGTTAAAVAAMSGVGLTQAVSVSGAQPLGRLVAARTGQGSVSQAGGFGAGLAGTGRPRPATALAAMLPPPPPAQSQQARPTSRQHQSSSGVGKGPVMRSKSASAALAARLHAGNGGGFVDPLGLSQASRPRAHTAAPSRYGSNHGGAAARGAAHGHGLPSMLVPRDKGTGAGRPGSALLQVYGPTAEQAAEAAAAAAALPYEVLDQQAAARQQGLGAAVGLPSAFGSPAIGGGLSPGMNGAGLAAAQAGAGSVGAVQGAVAAGGDSSSPQVWSSGAGTSPFRTAPVPASGNSRRSAIMRMSTCSDATETIHEEGATAPPPTRAGDPRAGLGDTDVYPPPTRGSGLSESGELPAFGGGGGGSLNSTMASSVSVASRRSTSTQALLSNDDMRTLRELNEAYSAAERLTQQLLAQAHEILSDEGSRPPSTGTSPHRPPHGAGHAQRRHSNTMLSPPTSLPNSRPGSRHGPNGDGQGSASTYTALVPPPSSSSQVARPGSSSGPQPPSRQHSAGNASNSSGAGVGGGSNGVRETVGAGSISGGRPPGLPPAGQRPGSTNLGRSPLSLVSRTSSGRRLGSVGSNDGSTLGLDSGSHAVAQEPGLVRTPSTSAHVMAEAVSLAGGLAHDGGMEEVEVADSGPVVARAADLFTSAEAELLTEALQD
eukprot:XP_001699423.1 predicted protein [Chlamydomonas reinhardtii]